MDMPHRFAAALIAMLTLLTCLPAAQAQHLWWKTSDKAATMAYGQIVVLATHNSTYYCGLNWHPGQPAGGYCGIQDNSGTEKRTIFSIWDTTDALRPKTTAADKATFTDRFGGEGTGGHTHMLWPWNLGETFEFCVIKSPGEGDSTDVKYYVFDRTEKKWLHSATINCPNGGLDEVKNFSSGGMAAFLENFSGKDKDAPRLALYRLWLGSKADDLKPVTACVGDGHWGTLGNWFFMANGTDDSLKPYFDSAAKTFGSATPAAKGQRATIDAPPIDAAVIAALQNLPQAPAAK
jgi:hypothetical protein